MKPTMRKGYRNPFLRSALAASAAVLSSAALHAEDLAFSGTGTVRLLAQDWAAYMPSTSTFNGEINDGGRLFWRGSAGDGQYIHFDLTRLSGLTVSSDASVTLQGARTQWGDSVTDSFIATANGSWTAAGGAAIPGATAIGDAVKLYDCSGNVVHAHDGRLMVLQGLEDCIVVSTKDALLVCRKRDEQQIKHFVNELTAESGERYV